VTQEQNAPSSKRVKVAPPCTVAPPAVASTKESQSMDQFFSVAAAANSASATSAKAKANTNASAKPVSVSASAVVSAGAAAAAAAVSDAAAEKPVAMETVEST